MKITSYNTTNGALAIDSITGINFGAMDQGAHSTASIAIKPITTSEVSFTSMKLFLQSKGGFGNSQFGYHLSSSFLSGVAGGSQYISDHFTVNANPSTTGAGAVTFTAAAPEYAWLDVQSGLTENGFSTGGIRYMFLFDYT